jgi:hypothetical protein
MLVEKTIQRWGQKKKQKLEDYKTIASGQKAVERKSSASTTCFGAMLREVGVGGGVWIGI